jgi:type I restriction enzyme S subunit
MKLFEREICTLGDVANYNKNRISTQNLNEINYISTENMLPNREGVTTASAIPKGKAIEFKEGQTLVSNIRPYFKKIWKANIDGGCSADVLVFDISEQIDETYFYYYLSQDEFFDYIMKGSKGTKMPRGDKQHILRYPFTYPRIEEQEAIAVTLASMDDKIELNNRINDNLLQMAQAIYKSWFVDFEPFQEGEFEESELGMIPKGWKVGKFENLVTVKYGKDHKKLSDGNIPVYGSGGVMRYVDKALCSSESVLIPRKGTLNNVIYVNDPFWSVDTMFFTQMNYPGIAKFVYFFIKSKDLLSMNAGSAVPSMTTEILNRLPIIEPPLSIIREFSELVTPFFIQMNLNNKQSENLANTRDALLPKLMSGEIRVPVEEV